LDRSAAFIVGGEWFAVNGELKLDQRMHNANEQLTKNHEPFTAILSRVHKFHVSRSGDLLEFVDQEFAGVERLTAMRATDGNDDAGLPTFTSPSRCHTTMRQMGQRATATAASRRICVWAISS